MLPGTATMVGNRWWSASSKLAAQTAGKHHCMPRFICISSKIVSGYLFTTQHALNHHITAAHLRAVQQRREEQQLSLTKPLLRLADRPVHPGAQRHTGIWVAVLLHLDAAYVRQERVSNVTLACGSLVVRVHPRSQLQGPEDVLMGRSACGCSQC